MNNKTISFKDANNVKYVINISLDKNKFSMIGKGNGSSGQCNNDICSANNKQKELLDIWKEYHLNDFFKKELPKNFWSNLLILCDQIEKIENEKRDQLIVDLIKNSDFNLKSLINQYGEKVIALAVYLQLSLNELNDVKETSYGYGKGVNFEINGTNYYCGNEEEMTNVMKEYIEQSLWTFNPSFLSKYGILNKLNNTDVNLILSPLQENCEEGNDAIKSLVQWDDNDDEITKDAINSDGYGHFLNSYDGTYSEITIKNWNNTTFIICEC